MLRNLWWWFCGLVIGILDWLTRDDVELRS